MFYFIFNESKISENFTFWNKLQKKKYFYTIFIFLDVPVGWFPYLSVTTSYVVTT